VDIRLDRGTLISIEQKIAYVRESQAMEPVEPLA
jgi:hypothetical protein